MDKIKYNFTNYTPILATLSAILIWSTLPALSIHTKDIPPFLRTGVGLFFSAISYIFYWRLKYKQHFIRRLRAPINYILFSILGIWGTNITFLAAMSCDNSMESYVILSSWPIIALFLTAIVWKEKITKLHYLGSLLGILGVSIISISGPDNSDHINRTTGILLAILNAIIWAGYSVLNKKFSHIHYDLIGIPLFAIACLSIIYHMLFEASFSLDPTHLYILAFLGAGPWGLSHMLWGYAMRNGDIKTLFNYGYLVPVLGILWSILFGYASLSSSLVISLLCIVIGSMLGIISHKK